MLVAWVCWMLWNIKCEFKSIENSLSWQSSSSLVIIWHMCYDGFMRQYEYSFDYHEHYKLKWYAANFLLRCCVVLGNSYLKTVSLNFFDAVIKYVTSFSKQWFNCNGHGTISILIELHKMRTLNHETPYSYIKKTREDF